MVLAETVKIVGRLRITELSQLSLDMQWCQEFVFMGMGGRGLG